MRKAPVRVGGGVQFGSGHRVRRAARLTVAGMRLHPLLACASSVFVLAANAAEATGDTAFYNCPAGKHAINTTKPASPNDSLMLYNGQRYLCQPCSPGTYQGAASQVCFVT